MKCSLFYLCKGQLSSVKRKPSQDGQISPLLTGTGFTQAFQSDQPHWGDTWLGWGGWGQWDPGICKAVSKNGEWVWQSVKGHQTMLGYYWGRKRRCLTEMAEPGKGSVRRKRNGHRQAEPAAGRTKLTPGPSLGLLPSWVSFSYTTPPVSLPLPYTWSLKTKVPSFNQENLPNKGSFSVRAGWKGGNWGQKSREFLHFAFWH